MTDSFYARVKTHDTWDEKSHRAYDEYLKEHPLSEDDRKSGLV